MSAEHVPDEEGWASLMQPLHDALATSSIRTDRLPQLHQVGSPPVTSLPLIPPLPLSLFYSPFDAPCGKHVCKPSQRQWLVAAASTCNAHRLGLHFLHYGPVTQRLLDFFISQIAVLNKKCNVGRT